MNKLIFIFISIFILFFYKNIVMFALFNDFYNYLSKEEFIKEIYKDNNFYKKKYKSLDFFKLPYLTKDELITYNNDIIRKNCVKSTVNDFIMTFYSNKNIIGQSTGGSSGKSTFIWMDKTDAYNYLYTFITSFKKNGYVYGDKILIFYPHNSYFTNEYQNNNFYLTLLFNAYFISFEKIDKEKAIEFVNSINNNKPDFIVIFPFVLLQLCILIKKNKLILEHFPRNINLSGEFLLQCSLNFCRKVFIYSNIENTYGAVEFGEIAHQIKNNKNVFKVFKKFCYLENNQESNIIVTSLINKTFPIIRYVTEDIGTVINHTDGEQYIVDLIGKNTNQIFINNITIFNTLDVDKLINFINNDNIISIIIEYDNTIFYINYILYNLNNNIEYDSIIKKTKIYLRDIINKYNIKLNINFLEHYEHNYLKKFKIIIKKDKSDDEPVGGFFKYI